MGRSWLGGSINGLAKQFGSLPAVSSVSLPTIEPVQRIDNLPSITGEQQAVGITPARPAEPTPQIAMPEYTDPTTGQTAMYNRPNTLFDPGTLAPVDPYAQDQQAFTDPFAGAGWGTGGNVSTMGGEWATLDTLNGAITSAATQTGVPPNLIKAMLAREGSFGHDKWVNSSIRPGDSVYAFNGIYRSIAQSYGIDFDRMVRDDGYAVWAMGRVLQGIKQNNPELQSWDDVAKFYFAGPNYTNPTWNDGVQGNTTQNYAYGPTGVITRWKALDQASGYTGGYGSGTASWDSIVPSGAVYEWGEFGGESTNGLYGYGTQYGMNGTQHTGADIVTPRGSTYYAPMGGTVMCAGTGVGQSADGSGCAAFGDVNGGAGRVEVLLDNGAMLIFGHSSASLLQPGQRFNAGAALGKSGTMNSDHIHLEARVRDPSTPSGWRIVDPRTVMGGGGWSGTVASSPWEQQLDNLNWNNILARPGTGW